MFGDVIGSGLIILIGFGLLMIKLPLKRGLWLLGHGLAVDIAITVLAYCLHWGTFTGVMAAAFAGLTCSVVTSGARWCVGYIRDGVYYPGWWDLRDKLVEVPHAES
jgi:hypothetical protein